MQSSVAQNLSYSTSCDSDFSTLWPRAQRSKENADVLNGISISENADELYVTG